MALKLWYDLMSQPCRALVITLKVNNIPFESKVIALRKDWWHSKCAAFSSVCVYICRSTLQCNWGRSQCACADGLKVATQQVIQGEHLMPDFAKVNPFQKVPVMEHNGFKLTESIAIVRYLAREFNIAEKWYPKDSKQQARVDEYLEWQHLNTRLFGSMIFRLRVINPSMEKKPVDEKQLDFYKKNFVKVLKNIEDGFLKDKPYISGDSISVADIFCACEIEQPLAIGFNPLPEVPKVDAWLNKVRKELEPYYSEVHSVPKLIQSAIEKGKL